VSVYLSVAPPDGFTRWGDADWERWLREHPWEAAARLCSRGDWTVFLHQVRKHCPRASKGMEPLLELLINERPLTSQQVRDLSAALDVARGELNGQPARAMEEAGQQLASAEDLETLIAAGRARVGKEPTLGEIWAALLSDMTKLLDSAVERKRGIYFGNV
jgi:hypothetical protein